MDEFEQRLRRLLGQGSHAEALALLHDRHAADVKRFIRFLNPSASCDDLDQEVWLAALRVLPRFRFQAAPRTWLFAIARRRLADAGRRRRGRRTVPLPLNIETLERALLPALVGPRRPSTPSSELRRKRRALILESELDRIDVADRELLELRFVEGLKPAAIVEILALPDNANTLSQRLLRLVRKLRQRLVLHDEFKLA